MVKKRALASRFRGHDPLDESPDHALVGVVSIPENSETPWRLIGKRVVMAVVALCIAVLVVWFDRGGYTGGGGANGELTLIDCFYYATVSLSTTGYGDITPITQQARLINTIVVTPLRLVFLILLVGPAPDPAAGITCPSLPTPFFNYRTFTFACLPRSNQNG